MNQWGRYYQLIIIIIIIIIIKSCSAHISTLLGVQCAETEKKHEYKQFTVIAKTTLCDEIHVQCNYKYTSNCDIRWVLSSDLNLVLLWQDLSLVGRWFQSLGAATEKDLSPRSVLKLVGAQIAWLSVDFNQFRNINWINVIKRFVNT